MNFESPRLNSDFLRAMPSAIALLDTRFTLVDASEQWYNLFGLTTENSKGKNWFKLFPNLSKDWRIRLEHTLYGVKDIQLLDKVMVKDGTIRHFIWHLNPWKDSAGKHYGIVVTVSTEK